MRLTHSILLRRPAMGAASLVVLIVVPVMLLAAILIVDFGLLLYKSSELRTASVDITESAAVAIQPNLTSWTSLPFALKDLIKQRKIGGFDLSTFVFSQQYPDQVRDPFAANPSDGWNTGVVESNGVRLLVEFERGFYRAIEDGSGELHYRFESLETERGAASAKTTHLGLPVYMLMNAVRVHLRTEGQPTIFLRYLGINILAPLDFRTTATISRNSRQMVAPFAIPACYFATDPNRGVGMSLSYNISALDAGNCSRWIRLGEAEWGRTERIHGVLRSSLYPRPPVSGTYVLYYDPIGNIERTTVDSRYPPMHGVIAAPAVADPVGMSPAVTSTILERLVSAPSLTARIGQPVDVLGDYGTSSDILDNNHLRELLAGWFTMPSAPDGLSGVSFIDQFGNGHTPSGQDKWKVNTPRLRRLRPDYPTTPSGPSGQERWVLSELLHRPAGFPASFLFPMGDLDILGAANSDGSWNDRIASNVLTSSAYTETGDAIWTNPLCHDHDDSEVPHVGIPRNNAHRVRVHKMLAMLVAPENNASDYCGDSGEGVDYVSPSSRPIVVGFMPIIVYDFNLSNLSARYENRGIVIPGDRPAITVPATVENNGCSYFQTCYAAGHYQGSPAQGDTLTGFPLTSVAPAVMQANFCSSTTDSSFPGQWPIAPALQGVKEGDAAMIFPWQSVTARCFAGYNTVQRPNLGFSFENRPAQYGCAGFAAMPECISPKKLMAEVTNVPEFGHDTFTERQPTIVSVETL